MVPQGRAYVRGARIGMAANKAYVATIKLVTDLVLGTVGFFFGVYEGWNDPDVAEKVIFHVQKNPMKDDAQSVPPVALVIEPQGDACGSTKQAV